VTTYAASEPSGKGGGREGYSGDEELRSVGVGTGVCHGEETGFRVLQFEVFVCEFLAIDGFSTRTTLSISQLPPDSSGGGGDTCDE
jgi:hypothetical protein